MKHTQKPRGFTLVELMVVIVIVAVLTSLAFMGGSRAIKASNSAKSLGNLRQLGMAVHEIRMEGIDNGHNSRGFFPPYAGQISAPSPFRNFNIYELIGERVGLCKYDAGSYQWQVHPSETILQNPLAEDELCRDYNTSEINNDSFKGDGQKGGYAYNHLVEGWVSKNTPPGQVKKTRVDRVKFPSLTILMAEQNPNRGVLWCGPYPNAVPQGNYKGKVHCLMVDGHAELIDNDYLASSEGGTKHLKLDAGR
jgi:prepilin-type N-terminal cleavage/methylation domain-containing protein/prepilin-type processing-associated H-X9-DG protein